MESFMVMASLRCFKLYRLLADAVLIVLPTRAPTIVRERAATSTRIVMVMAFCSSQQRKNAATAMNGVRRAVTQETKTVARQPEHWIPVMCD